MNIGEADDTITLLRWLTAGMPSGHLEDRAKASAQRLADRSRARIMAGISGDQVVANWPGSARG